MRRLDGYTTFGLVAYSIGFHLVVALVATSFGRPAPARASQPVRTIELTDVELAPSPVAAPGLAGADGAPRAQPHTAPRAKIAEPQHAPSPPPDKDPNAPATTPVASAAPPSSAAPDLADAVRHAMLSPASSAQPGAPGGGGGGGAAAGLGSYKGMLAGWLQARVAGGGGAADEPHELLRVTARVTLSPDRAITSYAIVAPSGHAAFDARIDAKLRAIVSSGATLPPPPDGIEAPPSLTVAFTCKPNERCA